MSTSSWNPGSMWSSQRGGGGGGIWHVLYSQTCSDDQLVPPWDKMTEWALKAQPAREDEDFYHLPVRQDIPGKIKGAPDVKKKTVNTYAQRASRLRADRTPMVQREGTRVLPRTRAWLPRWPRTWTGCPSRCPHPAPLCPWRRACCGTWHSCRWASSLHLSASPGLAYDRGFEDGRWRHRFCWIEKRRPDKEVWMCWDICSRVVINNTQELTITHTAFT